MSDKRLYYVLQEDLSTGTRYRLPVLAHSFEHAFESAANTCRPWERIVRNESEPAWRQVLKTFHKGENNARRTIHYN